LLFPPTPPRRGTIALVSARFQPRWPALLTGAFLFLASAAFVLWQNSQVAVLWDLGYLLNTSSRIAAGQLPYRDFSLVHPPLTFLIQATILRIFGRSYQFVPLYAAIVSGFGTLLTWRILGLILGPTRSARRAALALSLPLIFLGLHGIYPHPEYDCDCALALLFAFWLLLHARRSGSRPWLHWLTGAALILPAFVKQNMGLPVAAVAALALILQAWHAHRTSQPLKPHLGILAGMAAATALALVTLTATVGLANYRYWTITFAAQRRLPGLGLILETYRQPSLLWLLPPILIALALTRFPQNRWLRIAIPTLLAAPALTTAVLFFAADPDDYDTRADILLALWPLLLVLAVAALLWQLRHPLTPGLLVPALALTTIHGTFLSQQLWGSTYAIWPLALLLTAWLLSQLPAPPAVEPLAWTLAAVLLLCGFFYAASHERLTYTDLSTGSPIPARLPALHGLSARGPYVPEFEELILYSSAHIPPIDPVLELPGEDPFFYATGRTPALAAVLFDHTTNPWPPDQLLAQANLHHVRWILWKTHLQSASQPLDDPDRTLAFIRQQYTLVRKLAGYDIYFRRQPFPNLPTGTSASATFSPAASAESTPASTPSSPSATGTPPTTKPTSSHLGP